VFEPGAAFARQLDAKDDLAPFQKEFILAEPDNSRLGLAPLYTTFIKVWETVDRIRQVVKEERHLRYSQARQAAT
jgi:kynureninase